MVALLQAAVDGESAGGGPGVGSGDGGRGAAGVMTACHTSIETSLTSSVRPADDLDAAECPPDLLDRLLQQGGARRAGSVTYAATGAVTFPVPESFSIECMGVDLRYRLARV